MSGCLIILSAPSGAGKTTLVKPVVKELANLAFSISHTTRAPRSGEQDGVDYHFVSRERFEQQIEANDFLEWAEVHGNYYGTSKSSISENLAMGQDIILDIDVQGAAQIRNQGLKNAHFIFIAPPSLEALQDRLTGRGTDSAETIALRLNNAVAEMQAMPDYDYVIINDDLDEAIDCFRAIIIEKRLRSGRKRDGSKLLLPGV